MKKVLLLLLLLLILLILRQQYALEREAQAIRAQKVRDIYDQNLLETTNLLKYILTSET